MKIKKILGKIRNNIMSIYSLVVWKKIKKRDKKCLLISNGSTLSGAPLVLLEAAKVLRKLGYNPVFFTEYPGPIIDVARKEKISVIVAAALKNSFEAELQSSEYDCVIVNTITNYRWIDVLENTSNQIIWWLHEGVTYIDKMKEIVPQKLPSNVKVCCVSSWTAKTLNNYGLEYNYELLPYGCSDLHTEKRKKDGKRNQDKLKVAIIGNICDRKNQLKLLQFITNNSDSLLNKFEFVFVGSPLSNNDPYYGEFIDLIRGCPRGVKYKKSLSRDEMPDFYEQIDIVLCCSIDDPLPVVVTEGMMFEKVVITSSCTGQYDLIQDKVNGFKYNVEDFEELMMKFDYISQNRSELGKIGIKARQAYETMFMPKSFEKKIAALLSDEIV